MPASVVPFALASIALFAAAGSAQEQKGLRPGIDFAALDSAPARSSAAFTDFCRDHGGAWWSRWCMATGTPCELFGTGLSVAGACDSIDDARRHANAALIACQQLLGTDADEFRESIGTAFGNVFSFTFAQFHRGIPVIGGRADVRINKVGRIAFLGSYAFTVAADQPIVPAISELEATTIAWLALGKLRHRELAAAPRTTRLVLWGDIDSEALATVSLCFEVPVDAVDQDGSGPIGRYYVDAQSGKVLHYQNDKHECGFAGCARRAPHRHDQPVTPVPTTTAPVITPTTFTVMGFARDGRSCTTPATNVPMPGLEISVPGIGTAITDQNGQFTVDIASPANVTVALNGVHYQLITGASAVTRTATLQPGTPATIQLLTAGATAAPLAHTTCALWTHRINAWARGILGNSSQLAIASQVLPAVNIASTCNAFYTGNTINFYAAGGSCNNTASASIVAHEWGHGLDDRYGGISQTHGLSEGWGDICSEYQLDHPVIGEGFFTSGAGIRDGRNNTMYPPPAQVHAAGEVWMGFAWRFRENLRTSLGTQQAVAISEATVLASIAANAVDQPGAVTQVFIADDNDGNLVNGVPHYAELEAAALAKNLPYPVRQIGFVTAQPLADTVNQLQPRMVTATAVATATLGSFTQVRLVYDDGAPHSIAMIPTGVADQYRALLPGQPAPTTVSWHVEALHSSGALVRQPASGENRFLVYGLARFWFENFESGAAGWTHASTLGLDDWEIGTPMGLGTSGWSDPATAFSGTECAGTDLSVDGVHGQSADRSLFSPTIDCTGHTGIRLRFKRWLTVDSISRGDIAMVRSNGQFAWINAPAGLLPILDAGWVDQELRLTYADNHPAVVLEWYLHTNAAGDFGGWNIDDVELFSGSQAVPLPDTLQIGPAMAVQGSTMNIAVHTALPGSPFLIVAGTTPGPTSIPGLPVLGVGGIFADIAGLSDASGDFTATFTVPMGVPSTGLQWYYQALTVDASAQIVVTNPTSTLFTQ